MRIGFKGTMVAAASLWLAVAPVAIAADLPAFEPAPQPYTWHGLYAGIHGGFGWGDKHWEGTFAGTLFGTGDHTISGWLGGIQLGGNYQINRWVVGVEGEFSWAGIKGGFTGPFGIPNTISTDWLATLSGRIGFAPWERVLIFAKGGAAWAGETLTSTFNITTVTANRTQLGWMIGGGAEWAFADHWSAKIEYDYFDFGWARGFDTTGLGDVGSCCRPTNWDVNQHLNLVKAGVNYRF